MVLNNTFLVAALAVTASGLGLNSVMAEDLPDRIYIRAGETPAMAVAHARTGFEWQRILSKNVLGGARPMAVVPINPQIVSGTVLSAPVVVGNQSSKPVIDINFKSFLPLYYVVFDFVSPSGTQTLSLSYNINDLKTEGRVTFQGQQNFPPYTQPGSWVLEDAELVDQAGDYTIYTQGQLKKILISSVIKVENPGTYDATAPVILSGNLLTPAVSVGGAMPYFQAQITAKDTGSGFYAPYVFIAPQGAEIGFSSNTPREYPLPKASALSYENMSFETSGSWEIIGVEACDAANNCADANPDELFGHSTFSVTN